MKDNGIVVGLKEVGEDTIEIGQIRQEINKHSTIYIDTTSSGNSDNISTKPYQELSVLKEKTEEEKQEEKQLTRKKILGSVAVGATVTVVSAFVTLVWPVTIIIGSTVGTYMVLTGVSVAVDKCQKRAEDNSTIIKV